MITNYFTPTPNNDIVDLTLPPPDPVVDLTDRISRPDPTPSQGKRSEGKAVQDKATNRKVYHRYKNIPTPRIVINNVTAYSHARTDPKGYQRQRKVVSNLSALSTVADFILTQEIKTEKNSPIYRHLLRPKFRVFSNPHTTNPLIRGTDMFVAESLLKDFIPDPKIIVEGHIHAVIMRPKNGDSLFTVPFTVINVYLPSGNDSKTAALRASMLQSLKNFDPQAAHVFAGGDWNLTQFPSDSSGEDHFASTPDERKALADALDALGLKEVYQPAHTCIRAGERKSSSRIDRIYVSHSISEKCVMSPETTLPPHPFPPGGDGMRKGPTEHFPVLLTFYPRTSRGGHGLKFQNG